jgi:hypothetical protein
MEMEIEQFQYRGRRRAFFAEYLDGSTPCIIISVGGDNITIIAGGRRR